MRRRKDKKVTRASRRKEIILEQEEGEGRMTKELSRSHGLGKIAENTISSKLVAKLNELGLDADFERHIQTLSGIRKPDVFISNNGYWFGEAKQSPAKISDALSQAYGYREAIKQTVEPKAVFAILYPEKETGIYEIQVLLPYEPYVVGARFNSLDELAKWVHDFIIRPPPTHKIDIKNAIKLLQSAVYDISDALSNIEPDEIQDIFGGKSAFENVLQYEEGKYPKTEMRQAAAFLLINQLLFYRALSQDNPEFYSEINEGMMRSPSDLLVYFRKVLDVNYKATYSFDVVSKIPAKYLEFVKSSIRVIKALTPKKIEYDLLGKIFHDLIPFEIRKSVAAFYTNNEAAELLAGLSIDNADDKVMDLACGSGTLLVAAYHRKAELLRQGGRNMTENYHKKFLEEQITGIDIMPFAAHLAVVHLSLQAPLYHTEKVRIAVWDSTELKPDQTIPALSKELKSAYKAPNLKMFLDDKHKKEYIKKGAVSFDEIGSHDIPLSLADLVIMNPPFTRQERLPETYKRALNQRFSDYKDYLHGQLGLHGYFILLADMFLRPGGKMAFVLPATVLRLKSFEPIRKFLSKNIT